MVLILITGIPYAVLRAFLHLAEGLPRHAATDLLYVPLNWVEVKFTSKGYFLTFALFAERNWNQK